MYLELSLKESWIWGCIKQSSLRLVGLRKRKGAISKNASSPIGLPTRGCGKKLGYQIAGVAKTGNPVCKCIGHMPWPLAADDLFGCYGCPSPLSPGTIIVFQVAWVLYHQEATIFFCLCQFLFTIISIRGNELTSLRA